MSLPHLRLGVNIDHVATVRNARGGAHPDPVRAALAAEAAGADGITAHLREDRRHIRDADLYAIRQAVKVPLNFEMAATDEMVGIATAIRPQVVMLVPEGRHEVTTEGGLDVVGSMDRLRGVVGRLAEQGIPVSAFIDPDPRQVEAAAACGFAVCEVHTGPYAHAFHEHGRDADAPAVQEALREVEAAGRAIVAAGMRFNAGHALNYFNVQSVAALPDIRELHIGHAVVSRAVFIGLRESVREMKRLLREAAGPGDDR